MLHKALCSCLFIVILFLSVFFVFCSFPFFVKISVIVQENILVLQIFLSCFCQVFIQLVLIRTQHWGNLLRYTLLIYLCLRHYLTVLSILSLHDNFLIVLFKLNAACIKTKIFGPLTDSCTVELIICHSIKIPALLLHRVHFCTKFA